MAIAPQAEINLRVDGTCRAAVRSAGGNHINISYRSMDQEDPQLAALEQANARLRASLRQCREMVADYRERIAANVNVPDTAQEDDEADRA